MRGSFADARPDKIRCRHCKLKFALAAPEGCSYHPLPAAHVGTAGPNENFAEVWKFPCCGESVLESHAVSPGCMSGQHVADPDQQAVLETLRAGDSVAWNHWRSMHPDVKPDLEDLNLQHLALADANLADANFNASNLERTRFQRANLRRARIDDVAFWNADLEGSDLSDASLQHSKLCGGNWRSTVLDRAHLVDADLARIDLRKASLRHANLLRASLASDSLGMTQLSEADLSGAVLKLANCRGVDFGSAILANADLSGAVLTAANLAGANLRGANLSHADLKDANLTGADLTGAVLAGASLHRANLCGAVLAGADLSEADLVATNFTRADLSGCRIFGISAWDVVLEGAHQGGLIISKNGAATITVDDLEIAQFIYLLMNNNKIRNVINTVTSKAVLILGRFSDEHKPVLDALRDRLRTMDLAPIIFDFQPSANRDLTETVQLLAAMSRFVIADLTDAKSIPQELSHIIPNFLSVPVKPILLKGKQAYSMFEHWQRYDSVLPLFQYEDREHLIESLDAEIVGNVHAWEAGSQNKAQEKARDAAVRQAQDKWEALKAENPAEYQLLKERGLVA